VNIKCRASAPNLLLATALMACATAAAAQPAAPSTSAPATAVPSTGAPATGSPTRSPLLEAVLKGLQTSPDGKKVDSVMYITDFPPGSTSTRHTHPGWEFNYILKGAVTYQVEGQPPFTLKAGEGTFNQRGNIHIVKNASQTEPAQLVAVLVKDEGAPIAVNAP